LVASVAEKAHQNVAENAFNERIDEPGQDRRNCAAQLDGLVLNVNAAIFFLHPPIGIEPPHKPAILALGSP